MAHRQIHIDFQYPQDQRLVSEQSLVARVRALGEDLFREFSPNGKANLCIDEVDKAIDRLSLSVTSTRHIGEVIRFINNKLVRHKLADVARVSRIEASTEWDKD